MQFNAVGEIVIQGLWAILGLWLIYNGYKLNKKSKPFSLRNQNIHPHPIRDSYVAGGIVLGAALLILLAHKILNCGLGCWSY